MKVLLVQTGFLGDAVLATAALPSLAWRFPSAELWVMCTPQARHFFIGNPKVAGVIEYDKRGRHRGLLGIIRMARELRSHRFAASYALHKSYRTGIVLACARIPRRIGFRDAQLPWLAHRRIERPKGTHEVLRVLSLVREEPHAVPFREEEGELSLPTRTLAELSPSVYESAREAITASHGYAVVVPGSVWPTKRWTAEGFAQVMQLMRSELGMPTLVLGAPDEASVCGQVATRGGGVSLGGATSLTELMALIASARVVVCNDSLALHLASAYKVPTVAVFCATVPEFGFGPWRNRAIVVERLGLHCRPCGRHGGRSCPTGTHACMREVSAAQVMHAVREVCRDDLSGAVC